MVWSDTVTIRLIHESVRGSATVCVLNWVGGRCWGLTKDRLEMTLKET